MIFSKKSKNAFLLTNCTIIYDESDFTVVEKASKIFAEDIKSVTNIQPFVTNKATNGNLIILGTIGYNKWIDQLVSDGKLNISGIKDGWEQFIIQRMQKPFPGVEQALIIVESDRRGTAYRAFTHSEAMGVSAWEWWADVPVKLQKKIYVVNDFISRPPSIKYRGIFINDEDWGGLKQSYVGPSVIVKD